MPTSAMKPTDAGTERNSPDSAQRDDAADRREGHVAEHQHRLPHRVEGEVEQQEDQRRARSARRWRGGPRRAAGSRTGRPSSAGSPAGTCTAFADRRLGLGDEADQVAAAHVGQHGRIALRALADHLDRPFLLRYRATWDSATVRPPGSDSDRRARGRSANAAGCPRRAASAGCGAPASSTMPMSRPSTQTRSACCTSRTLMPSRPAAKRSISTLQVLHALVAQREDIRSAGDALHGVAHLARRCGSARRSHSRRP